MKYIATVLSLLLSFTTGFAQNADCSGGSDCIPRTVSAFSPDGREVFVWLCAINGLYLHADYPDPVNSYERKDSTVKIVSSNPVYRGKIEFIFVNGEKYEYDMADLYSTARAGRASFKALLQGEVATTYRHRHAGHKEKNTVEGDHLLLVRLACHPIRQINYSPVAYYADRGKLRPVAQQPLVIKLNEEDAILLREDVRCMLGMKP
jgi:hypothetical protein